MPYNPRTGSIDGPAWLQTITAPVKPQPSGAILPGAATPHSLESMLGLGLPTGIAPPQQDPQSQLMDQYRSMLLGMMKNGGGTPANVSGYDAQINELRRQLGLAENRNKQGTVDTTRGYDFLTNYYNKNMPAQFAKNYGAGRANLEKINTQERGATEAAQAASAKRLQDEMARTGQLSDPHGAALITNVQSQGEGHKNDMVGLAAERAAANKDFFANMQAADTSFAHSSAGNAQSTKQRMLGDLRNQLAGLEYETGGKISDIMGQRAAALAQAASQGKSNKLSLMEKLMGTYAGADPKAVADATSAQAKAAREVLGTGSEGAINRLKQAAGTNTGEFQDLFNELQTLLTGNFKAAKPGGGYEDKTVYQSGKWSPQGASDPQIMDHLRIAIQNANKSGRGWGFDQQQAIMQALDLMLGNRNVSYQGTGG